MSLLASTNLDIQSKLEQTDFTVEWLLQILQEHNGEFEKARQHAKVEKITAYDISEGKGYCSRVLKITAHFDDPKLSEYTCILKVPTEEFIIKLVGDVTEIMSRDKLLAEILYLHNVECDAYTLMRNIQTFPIPHIYYTQKAEDNKCNGAIMMEDLSSQCITAGIFITMREQHCLNVAGHFADFQAYIETLDQNEWSGRFQRSIYTREDLLESERRGLFVVLNYKNGELHDQIKFFLDIDWHKFSCHTVRDRAEEFDALTLCHGDAWTNNMLIKLNSDGSLSNQIGAFIDWQTFFEGSPLHDLSRFLITCTDAEVRRGIQKEAVNFYYDRLVDQLKAKNLKVRFTREQAHELYELASIQQTQILIKVFAYLALPFAKTGKPEDAAKVEKIWLRLRLALEDAQPIIEKYEIRTRFAV